jgi:hypothetical protein
MYRSTAFYGIQSFLTVFICSDIVTLLVHGMSLNINTQDAMLEPVTLIYVPRCLSIAELVGIATKLRAGRPKNRGSIWAGKDIFFYSIAFRLGLWPTQPPMQWVSRLKRPGREADHSPPSNAEVKNSGTIPPLPPYILWRGT